MNVKTRRKKRTDGLCAICGIVPREVGSYCKPCRKEYSKEYRLNNIEVFVERSSRYYRENKSRVREWYREDYRRDREAIIQAYGGKCSCHGCGENTYEFLAIDHANNDGAKERRETWSLDKRMKRIIKEGFPDRYQVLCHNCNNAKGHYGKCPHADIS